MNRLAVMRRFSLSISTAAVLVAALALPATTVGAIAKITFGHEWDGLRLGSACISGHAPSGATLHLVWKSSAGTVKANTYLATNDWGDWAYCSDDGDVLAASDLLKASVGASTRKFVVPLVTINVDRVHDVLRGHAPAGATLDLWIDLRGCCWDHSEHDLVTADADGKWVYPNGPEFSFDYGTEGFDVRLEWHNARGDFLSDNAYAPEATVRINRSFVVGYGEPGSDWKLALWDTVSGVRKGVAKGVVEEWGSFSGVFLDASGEPVTVLPGDKIVGTSLASDMRFIVKDIQASADVATDIVTGTCGNAVDGKSVAVYRGKNEIGWSFFWTLDDLGNFSVDFGGESNLGYDPANIRHGDRLLVTCETIKGDFFQKWIRVP